MTRLRLFERSLVRLPPIEHRFRGPCLVPSALIITLVAAISASSSFAIACPGDCDANGTVSVDELVLGVVVGG